MAAPPVSTVADTPADSVVQSLGVLSRRLRSAPTKALVGAAILVFFILLAVIGPLLAPHSATWQASLTVGQAQAPSAHLWLGTDQQQHDIWSLMLLGGRSTLLIAFLAGAAATVLSVVIGVTAGYFGGVVDELLSALTNIFLALPGLMILMLIMKPLPPSETGNPVIIGLVVAITSWAYGARALRAQTLSLRNQDYVESARIIGERKPRIIMYEVLPNLLPIVSASFIFTVIYGMGVYVALCFLGVVNPSSSSWGTMIETAQNYSAMIANDWWWYAPPALAIAVVGIGLALLNFGIDEIINPRIRSERAARGTRALRRLATFRIGMTPVVRGGAARSALDPDATQLIDISGAAAAGKGGAR